tara:strand:+ start:66 stop:215 length:150 start_codon:yes stop_codon:yes gene_type:complete
LILTAKRAKQKLPTIVRAVSFTQRKSPPVFWILFILLRKIKDRHYNQKG